VRESPLRSATFRAIGGWARCLCPAPRAREQSAKADFGQLLQRIHSPAGACSTMTRLLEDRNATIKAIAEGDEWRKLLDGNE
jgi:hypothetical protein